MKNLTAIASVVWFMLAASAILLLAFHAAGITICLVAWCGGVISAYLVNELWLPEKDIVIRVE